MTIDHTQWQEMPPPQSNATLIKAFHQLNRLRQCIAVGRSISSSQSIETILDRLMVTTMHTLGAQNCSLFLTDRSQTSMRLVMSRGPIGSTLKPGIIVSKGQGIPGRVFATGNPLLLQSTEQVLPGDILAQTTSGDVHTTLCLPIAFEDNVLGVAKLTNTHDGRAFDADDQEVFNYVCDQASIAIHNVYQHENELALQSIEEEMERAGAVHHMLFPSKQPDLPGFDICGTSLSCHKVGGDYFDFIQLEASSHKLAIVVADVVGHGTSAALLMASLRAYCRSYKNILHDPGQALTAINKLYCDDAYEAAYFCTAFLLVIDTSRGCLSWACAGHPPVIFYDPIQDDFFELTAKGIPLGCNRDYVYLSQTSGTCKKGQICFIGTDGAWEESNSAGDLFGRQRVQDIIRSNKDKSSSQIAEAIIRALTEFTGRAEREDDITMVIIKKEKETLSNSTEY
ncbi:GAF domain-containing SpoIIE family protein phosphatase [Desulfovibrio inopinatus]|uniref:GAF domain-containing SpoIIE family protein phosphatase n=1 Tax=Desulfovibrio inopinatus TaxID=102109 RepID=UPI00040D12D5|nr:GAF domain-containing SpoIIE family protein phosphatase [Desulfovibrio inopinatus]